MRKRIFSLKNVFLSILPFCAVIFSACNLLQETPGSFLEDYGSIATVAQTNISASSTISQGGWLNVGSDGELKITYIIDNPGNHRLRAKVSLPHISSPDLDFPENDYLLQSWTEKVERDDGTFQDEPRTENDEDFLKSTFTLTISQSDLDDGGANCDISPIVTLYRADFGEEDRIQSRHTINLRCNTPPQAIGPAVGQMVKNADDSVQTLVLAIKLPTTLKPDDKYLIVSALGQTHTFVAPFTSGASTDGLWTISSTAPANMEKTWDGGDSAAGIGANCYITTNINIKNRAGFAVDFTLQDEFGLISKYTLNPSHGAQLSPPYYTTPGSDAASITLEQSESDGMATYTLRADAGTIHYTISQTSGGSHTYSESGASPLAIKLPAGKFSVSAFAKKEGFIDSTEFKQDITIEPNIFFVSASGSDTSGDGSKSNPFATITKAHDSFGTLASSTPKILLLSNLAINSPVTLSNAVLLQGAAGGTKGSRVTLTANLASGDSAFAISDAVEMNALTLTQAASSASIASGISIASGGSLSLGNVSVTGMNTADGAVVVEGALTLNASGNVKITGNTSGGAAKNVYLPTGKTINIMALSLAGSQIGVFTAEKPGATTGTGGKVQITSGYNSAGGYKKSDLAGHIESDEKYALTIDTTSGEVQLESNSGSIEIIPPKNIVFSFSQGSVVNRTSGDGSGIAIYAFGDGKLLDIDDFTDLTAYVYLGTTTTGMWRDLQTQNPFDFDNGWDSGTYPIKIRAIYGGQEYNGELTYVYTKPSQP